jgi:N-methylhydantoinase A
VSATAQLEVGVDVGGTFTDCVLANRATGAVWSNKILTTHDLPSRAIFEGVERLCALAGIRFDRVGRFVHTTTLVGNAVIEGRGLKTALITTKGFRDTLQLRREYRYDLFDALLPFPQPLVPRSLSFELDARMDFRGRVLKAIDADAVKALALTLKEKDVRAVAVALIHAYANADHETAVAEILARVVPDIAVSLSSRVLPRIREYERMSATAINAYVQPLIRTYLDDLEAGLRTRGCTAPVIIVTSSGGTITADTAKDMPIQLVESGPAAGVVFAARLGRDRKADQMVAFDMGGTTAKVCIIQDGNPRIREDLEVARAKRFKPGSGLPVGIPLFDLLEIGAGGGSIAGLDATGLIQVGPHSAGSTPGPACYGRGGLNPTVTDANLCLGILDPATFKSGDKPLDVVAAREAIGRVLGTPLGVSVETAANAIFRLVNDQMAEALRMRSVESNVDVRRFAMMVFGGGGGIHGVEVARRVGIRTVICPPRAGVFSAAGLLVAPTSIDVLRTHLIPLAAMTADRSRAIFAALESEARASLVDASDYRADYAVDVAYVGQEFEISVPAPRLPETEADWAEVRRRFEHLYRASYGRILDGYALKIVTWRLKLSGPLPDLLAMRRKGDTGTAGRRTVIFEGIARETAVHHRGSLKPGAAIEGPAIIADLDTTLVVPPEALATCEPDGTIVIAC